jgi:hypothetical protein
MAKHNLAELKERADAIYQAYDAGFAGKPRATRDLVQLDDLIGKLEALISDARENMNGGRNPAIISMVDTAKENLERYREERSLIAELKANDTTVEAAHVANRANRIFDVYGRHFAGLDRSTRDARLLDEMVESLQAIRAQMERLVENGAESAERDLDVVNRELAMYRDEANNIRAAYRTGTPSDRVNRLAALANEQFALYNAQFAGKGRTTRRPELLERMIANLEEYRSMMRQVQQSGFASTMNANNIGIVADNLEMYRKELEEIRNVRSSTSPNDLAGMLGGAANEIMAEYRENFAGKERATRDLKHLGNLCDALWEVARQMETLRGEPELDFNEKNLQIVHESWATYESEYKRIKEAQGVA